MYVPNYGMAVPNYGMHVPYHGTEIFIAKTKHLTRENGYYRLVPVCVAQREDGSWDEFFAMKKAPIIEVELSDGRGRISEICSTDVVFS